MSSKAWAKDTVKSLYDRLGTWAKVAEELAPYLDVTRTTWWRVSNGVRIDGPKINALRRYYGLPEGRNYERLTLQGELLHSLDALRRDTPRRQYLRHLLREAGNNEDESCTNAVGLTDGESE